MGRKHKNYVREWRKKAGYTQKEVIDRLRERISGVFRFGIPLQICNADPAALITDELSPRPVQRPQPALVDLTDVVKLLVRNPLVEGEVVDLWGFKLGREDAELARQVLGKMFGEATGS